VIIYQGAIVVVSTLWIMIVARRFAPAKRAHAQRALTVAVFFFLSFGVEVGLRQLKLTQWVGTFDAIGSLLLAVNVIAAVGLTLFDTVLPRVKVRVPALISEVTMGVAYLVAAIVVLKHAGLELTGIVTTSAVVTGILALSLQATLGNVIGGVALQADKSIEVGDWIRLDSTPQTGIVTKIGWRHTVVETNNWDTLTSYPTRPCSRPRSRSWAREEESAFLTACGPTSTSTSGTRPTTSFGSPTTPCRAHRSMA